MNSAAGRSIASHVPWSPGAMRSSLLIILMSLTLSACLSTPARSVDNVCSLFDDQRAWFRAAEQSQQRWNVPVGVSMAFLY